MRPERQWKCREVALGYAIHLCSISSELTQALFPEESEQLPQSQSMSGRHSTTLPVPYGSADTQLTEGIRSPCLVGFRRQIRLVRGVSPCQRSYCFHRYGGRIAATRLTHFQGCPRSEKSFETYCCTNQRVQPPAFGTLSTKKFGKENFLQAAFGG